MQDQITQSEKYQELFRENELLKEEVQDLKETIQYERTSDFIYMMRDRIKKSKNSKSLKRNIQGLRRVVNEDLEKLSGLRKLSVENELKRILEEFSPQDAD